MLLYAASCNLTTLLYRTLYGRLNGPRKQPRNPFDIIFQSCYNASLEFFYESHIIMRMRLSEFITEAGVPHFKVGQKKIYLFVS